MVPNTGTLIIFPCTNQVWIDVALRESVIELFGIYLDHISIEEDPEAYGKSIV
jgi:hypothetical protein